MMTWTKEKITNPFRYTPARTLVHKVNLLMEGGCGGTEGTTGCSRRSFPQPMGITTDHFAQMTRELEARVGAEGVALARLRLAGYIQACAQFGVPTRSKGARSFAYIEALEEVLRGDAEGMLAGADTDRSCYEQRNFAPNYDEWPT